MSLGEYQSRYPGAIDSSSHISAAKIRVLAVRSFMKAIKYGSKFTYQSVPRLLTIWLDMGEDKELRKTESFIKVMAEVNRILPDIPAYKVRLSADDFGKHLTVFQWYTAFPQITSRVGHDNAEVWKSLSKIILQVISEYPQQALWQFAPVVKSRNNIRNSRGRQIVNQLLVRFNKFFFVYVQHLIMRYDSKPLVQSAPKLQRICERLSTVT